MSTALVHIQAALDAHLQALAAEPEVAWDGLTYEPRADRNYVTTQMAARQRRPMALNAATPWEWRGIYTIVVRHIAAEGLRPAYARAGVVASHYARGLTLVSSGVKVIILEAGLPPHFKTPGWINQPVQVSWTCEEPPT